MFLSAFILLALAVFSLADTITSSSDAPNPYFCTVTYNATQPDQKGPTSTVYRAIMTTYLFVSDDDPVHE